MWHGEQLWLWKANYIRTRTWLCIVSGLQVEVGKKSNFGWLQLYYWVAMLMYTELVYNSQTRTQAFSDKWGTTQNTTWTYVVDCEATRAHAYMEYVSLSLFALRLHVCLTSVVRYSIDASRCVSSVEQAQRFRCICMASFVIFWLHDELFTYVEVSASKSCFIVRNMSGES